MVFLKIKTKVLQFKKLIKPCILYSFVGYSQTHLYIQGSDRYCNKQKCLTYRNLVFWTYVTTKHIFGCRYKSYNNLNIFWKACLEFVGVPWNWQFVQPASSWRGWPFSLAWVLIPLSWPGDADIICCHHFSQGTPGRGPTGCAISRQIIPTMMVAGDN